MNHDATLTPGTKLPLICTYTDNVVGKGYVAKVEMRGRILAVIEDDCSVSLYAVEPCGWADTAGNLYEACVIFRQTYTAMLYDLAQEADTFEAFRDGVKAIEACADPLNESWKEAVVAHRSELAEKLDLRVEPAATMAYLRVHKMSALSPEDNQLDPALPALAGRDAA